jgi:hypothetical protein
MDFDWKQILGPLLTVGGTALGAVIGGPAGPILGPIAGKALAEALGCEPTPDAVGAALGQPDAAGKVAAVEAAHAPALRAAERTYLDDIADARATTVALAKEGSGIAWGAPVISVLIVCGFLALVFGVMFKAVPDGQATFMLFGALATAFGQVTSYWLGSSASSKSKDVTIADAMKSAAGVVTGAIKPRVK